MAGVRGTGWLAGIIGGGFLVVAGPLSGLIFTLLGLGHAFSSTGSPHVAPSDKARVLAEGISESMNGTAVGIVVGLVGLVVLVVSIIGFVRANRGANQATPPE